MSRRRNSLSDWWSRSDETCSPSPEAAAAESDLESEEKHDSVCNSPTKRFSPTKRSGPNFFIGDDSDTQSAECSPRKKLALSSPADAGAAGGVSASPGHVDTLTMSLLRSICSEYFENNVTPVLKFIQQSQEQLMGQIKEVTGILEKKADSEDVATVAQIEQIAGRAACKADDSKVAMHVRLEQLAAQMNQKACASNVPTIAQFKEAVNQKNAPQSIDKEQGELESRLRTAEQKVAALNSELQELKKLDSTGAAVKPADNRYEKQMAAMAVAGLRVKEEMKTMRKDMQQLREECLGKDVGERWPGRRFRSTSVGSADSISDNDSDKLSLGSAAESLSSRLEPEERAELRKIKTIVASAGEVYSRDLRSLKKQVQDLTSELRNIKGGKSVTMGS